MPLPRKWFTCTPVRFKGDHTFFARDSGLLCKGFQEIGIECRAIMPGPPMEGDQVDDLIRTEYSNLEDADWWRSLRGEGVVFYGWGAGKYARIAHAIRRAGLVLVSNMDTAGIVSILNGISSYSGNLWRVTAGERGKSVASILHFATRLVFAATVGLIHTDWRRAQHLKQAHLIGTISPIALDHIRKVCRIYGGEALASRVQLIPHSNASYMIPDPTLPKERLLVAVGRWDDARVKGTDLLIATAQMVTECDPDLVVEIYGQATDGMEKWHLGLPPKLREQVRLRGIVPNIDIKRALQRARVALCTSLRESYHIVSAEALCCGCSVVGPDVQEIPSMKWFTDGPFGRSAGRTATELAQAVLAELSDWDAGHRVPDVIAAHWNAILHAPQIARRILSMLDQPQRCGKSSI